MSPNSVSEARAAAGLMDPNVVNVYDVGQDRGLYFMVMELVEGITSERLYRKERQTFCQRDHQHCHPDGGWNGGCSQPSYYPQGY